MKLLFFLSFLFLFSFSLGGMHQWSGKLGPLTLPRGLMTEQVWTYISRPPGDIAISSFQYDIIDVVSGVKLPIEDIYNHHIIMTRAVGPHCFDGEGNANCSYDTISAIGAENQLAAITLPDPYRVKSYANESWALDFEAVNLLGIPAGVDLDVVVTYTISYMPIDVGSVDPYINVYWLIFSIMNGTEGNVYNVPGNGGRNSVYTRTLDYGWNYPDFYAVQGIGHLHIGSINTTFHDLASGELICASHPQYDENYFVVSLSQCFPNVYLRRSHTLRLTVNYDNSRPWSDVMGMMFLYAHSMQEGSATRSISSTSHLPSPNRLHPSAAQRWGR